MPAFEERVDRFTATHKVGELSGVPIVAPAPGGDAYLIGSAWRWYPVLKLKKDQTYRLHVSSGDFQHGFSLLPLNMTFHVLPGYDHVPTLTPTSSGEFPILLLDAECYQSSLTAHGMNMLIFWILFFEIAVLHLAAATLLKCRIASVRAAWASFILMVVGALMVNGIVFAGEADMLMTSYLPLLGHPLFYLGIILFAVGALIGVINFFATIYIARRDKTFQGAMPLVTFGAMAAAIIAVVTLLHGASAMIPTFLHSVGVMDQKDPGWYRLIWWALGHQSQQVNVCAMVAIWYFIATLSTGARPLNEAVCRGAFALYILFINIASAHHLLVDPGVGAESKIWDTSYAMYLAVMASMIHGFTVPASVEVAMRGKGHARGLFGWLRAAPWANPAFSGFVLPLVIFGFIGGITGVTLGTQQIHITAHNTLRIPGHFHATVVGGTPLAFMAMTHFIVPLIVQREFGFRRMAKFVATGAGEAAERAPGPMVLVILLFASFAIHCFANWKAFSDVWPVR